MIKQYGSWCAEITEMVLRKTPAYGLPYTAICTLKIVDKEVHVVGLLSMDKITKKDWSSLNDVVRELGYETFTYTKKEP
jgi:hypothetical protein